MISDIDSGMVVGARQAGLNISGTKEVRGECPNGFKSTSTC